MLTPEGLGPGRFVTGGATQQIIRRLSEGVTPTQIYGELFRESPHTAGLSEVNPYPYDPNTHPDELRHLERERLRAGQMTSSVEAYLQARADAEIAELAVNDAVTWPEILHRMHEEQPEAWRLAEQELPNHPKPAIDFVAAISSLNHISTVDAGEKLSHRDPSWRDNFIKARVRGELVLNQMYEILESFIETQPELKKTIEQLRQVNDFSTYADNLSGVLLKQYGVKMHPRVIVMGLINKTSNSAQHLYRDAAPDSLTIRISNARTAFETISAYAGVLRNHDFPEASIASILLSENNLRHMSSWTQRTFHSLPFSYVSGMPPDLRNDVNNWRAMISRASETARVSPEGTVIIPPHATQSATRGHCPVQHSLEDTDYSAGHDSVTASHSLEKRINVAHGNDVRLVREVARGDLRLRSVRLAEVYVANAILIAAKPGGPLDPTAAEPLWKFM